MQPRFVAHECFLSLMAQVWALLHVFLTQKCKLTGIHPFDYHWLLWKLKGHRELCFNWLLKTSFFYLYFICQGKCLTSGRWDVKSSCMLERKEIIITVVLLKFWVKSHYLYKHQLLLMPLEVKNKIIWWFVIIFEVIDNYIMIFVPSLETSEVKYLEKVIKSWEK